MPEITIKIGEKINMQFSAAITKSADKDADIYQAAITTIAVDRDKDVVVPKGINTKNYEKSPSILWAHNHDIPAVGKAVKLTRSDDKIIADFRFADKPEGWEGPWLPLALKSLVDQGCISAVSQGFIPTEVRPASKKDKEIFGKDVGQVISKSELLEFSIVNVGSNQEALIGAYKACGAEGGVKSFAKSMFGIDVEEKEEAEDKATPEEALLVPQLDVDEDGDSGLTGFAGEPTHQHTYQVLATETGSEEDHSHPVSPGGAVTGETNEHTHSIPEELREKSVEEIVEKIPSTRTIINKEVQIVIPAKVKQLVALEVKKAIARAHGRIYL